MTKKDLFIIIDNLNESEYSIDAIRHINFELCNWTSFNDKVFTITRFLDKLNCYVQRVCNYAEYKTNYRIKREIDGIKKFIQVINNLKS
jgi:hypothetical protein